MLPQWPGDDASPVPDGMRGSEGDGLRWDGTFWAVPDALEPDESCPPDRRNLDPVFRTVEPEWVPAEPWADPPMPGAGASVVVPAGVNPVVRAPVTGEIEIGNCGIGRCTIGS